MKCSWSKEKESSELDTAALGNLDWRPRATERVLLFPLQNQNPDLFTKGVSIWNLKDLWKKTDGPITDLDLMTRDELRVPLRPDR